MILKDYICHGHGIFESATPVCPHGCTTVEVIFLKAPGLKSDRTKFADKQLAGLAKDFNLTDMSNRNGNSVMDNLKRAGNTPQWLNSTDKEKTIAGGDLGPVGDLKAAGTIRPPKPLVIAEHKATIPRE